MSVGGISLEDLCRDRTTGQYEVVPIEKLLDVVIDVHDIVVVIDRPPCRPTAL